MWCRLLRRALPAARALLCGGESGESDGAGDRYPTPSGLLNKSGCAYKPPLNPHLPAPSQPAGSTACFGARWAAGTDAELRQRHGCPRDVCAGCERFGRRCLLQSGDSLLGDGPAAPAFVRPSYLGRTQLITSSAAQHSPPRELSAPVMGPVFRKAGLTLRDIGIDSYLNNCWGDKTALCANPT